MITKWKVFNFKSIRGETELDLGPLTIFAGANSSGKSTFIQSVLLVAQTLAHKVGSRSVVLNGALTRLGQFDDLKSTDGESNQIAIKCTCQPLTNQSAIITSESSLIPYSNIHNNSETSRLKNISCEFSIDADHSSAQRDLLQLQPRLFSSQVSCVSRDEDNIDKISDISIHYTSRDLSKIHGLNSLDDSEYQIRSGLKYAVEIDKISMSEVKEKYKTAKPIGCIIKHFLPKNIVYSIDTIGEQSSEIARALQDPIYRSWKNNSGFGDKIQLPTSVVKLLDDIFHGLNGYCGFDFVTNNSQITIEKWFDMAVHFAAVDDFETVLKNYENLDELVYEVIMKSLSTSHDNHVLIGQKPPELISESINYLEYFFTSLFKYLGPLRDEPKLLYPLASALESHDVGIKGENTASVLNIHRNTRIKYIPSGNFKSAVINRSVVSRTLEAAVIDWLQYLDVAQSVISNDRGKLGHELKIEVANSKNTHDLTHVGVGVSQVLPILVMCLLADTDSTLVFEQPELHLHPKVQTLLGDFFLSMALCNKQCIVETHSEYLIDRLRFRIAAAPPEKELNSQAKIYFVEKPSECSTFREVIINEYGAISDWPEGFFDQSQQQAEEILRAAAMKRKASRRNKDA